MPMIASQFGALAEQAIGEKKSHGYLQALLLAEIEARAQHDRAAHPRSSSDTCENPGRVRLRAVAERDCGEGGSLERAEPVLFIGELRHWQNTSADRTLRGGVPAETTGPIHHSGWIGERTR